MIDKLIQQMVSGARAAAIRWLKSKIPALITVSRDPRRSLSDREKCQVFIRDGGKCRYCGRDTSDYQNFDHVYPWSAGGETSVANTVLSCPECNMKKGDTIGIWPVAL